MHYTLLYYKEGHTDVFATVTILLSPEQLNLVLNKQFTINPSTLIVYDEIEASTCEFVIVACDKPVNLVRLSSDKRRIIPVSMEVCAMHVCTTELLSY